MGIRMRIKKNRINKKIIYNGPFCIFVVMLLQRAKTSTFHIVSLSVGHFWLETHSKKSPKHRRDLMTLEHIMHTVKLHVNIATQHVELT